MLPRSKGAAALSNGTLRAGLLPGRFEARVRAHHQESMDYLLLENLASDVQVGTSSHLAWMVDMFLSIRWLLFTGMDGHGYSVLSLATN